VDVHKGRLSAMMCAAQSEHWKTVLKRAVSTLLVSPNCLLRIQDDRAILRAEVKGRNVAAAIAATSDLLGSVPVKTVVEISDINKMLAINEAGKTSWDGTKTVEALKKGKVGSQSCRSSTGPRDLCGGEVIASGCDTDVARAN
jgi:hypothetical protein